MFSQTVPHVNRFPLIARFRVGQNIFVAGSSGDTLDTPNWNATITSWYSEVKNMNATFVSSFP